ncbi:MAG: CPBP family intramembrane metalloprotease, partial [Cytophagaceae bacterium]
SIEGPVLEELAFRPALIPTRLNIALSLSFLTILLSTILFSLNTPIRCALTVVLSALIFLIVRYGPIPKLLAGLTVSQPVLLVITSVGFGLIHIFNFHPFYGELFFLYPIYVLPQIVMGFILGITRLRLGLIWSILLHILSNGLLVWHKLLI